MDSCGPRPPAKNASYVLDQRHTGHASFPHSHTYDELMAANTSPWNLLSNSGTPMCGLQRKRKDTVGGTAALFPVTKSPTHHSMSAGAQSAAVLPRGHRVRSHCSRAVCGLHRNGPRFLQYNARPTESSISRCGLCWSRSDLAGGSVTVEVGFLWSPMLKKTRPSVAQSSFCSLWISFSSTTPACRLPCFLL